MSKGELIDSRVALKQCQKAVEALHSHELKRKEKFEENQILPSKEQHIWLNVTLKTIPAGRKLKPVKIPIVHPLVDPRTSSVCLITKDPQREYKDLLETHKIKFISRVVGIEKLKGKFKPFEARRMLLKENGMFLADERVIPLLPKLLGSKWFEAKKQPIPVCLTRKDLKSELERAISSTYMNQNQGTCISIKVGKMSQNPSQIVENIKMALPAIVKAIKGNWDNIQSLNIKTNSSVSLPIWSCTLDGEEGGRWNGLQAVLEDVEGDAVLEDGENEAKEAKKSPDSKSRKRQSDSDEEGENEKPKKKAKAVDGAEKVLDVETSKATAAADIPKFKKRKATEPSSPLAEILSEGLVSTAKGKKTQKAKETPVGGATTVGENTQATSDSEKKQKKTHNPSLTVDPQPLAPIEAPSKKKKTGKIQPPFNTGPSQKLASSSSLEKTGRKTSKILKEADSTVPSVVEKLPKPMLSRNEMKQKRNAVGLEKKKEIIAKAKGGKSAKNAVLGRKVAQE